MVISATANAARNGRLVAAKRAASLARVDSSWGCGVVRPCQSAGQPPRMLCRSGGGLYRLEMTAGTRPALLLAHPSPHAVVLPGVQREGQALPADWAAGADRLRLRDLVKGGARRARREEHFRVSVPACGQQPPVPAGHSDHPGTSAARARMPSAR